MKRVLILLAVLAMLVPLGFAQGAGVDVAAAPAIGTGVHATATFGLYNEVTATWRHCAKYATTIEPSLAKKIFTLGTAKSRIEIDTEACTADPSTVFAVKKHHNLTTNAGKDFIKAQISGTATTSNCIYIAVGTTAITPAVTDTTLSGEVTTNGLQRAPGTYAAVGTGTFTLTKLFTATGAVSNVQAASVSTAASSGTMCFEVGSLGPTTLASTDTLNVVWSGTAN